jgi:hypothetical protein
MEKAAAIFLAFFAGLVARAQTTFDLSADFSFRDNPGKVWQYGYSDRNSLTPDQFRVDIQSDRVDTQCDPTGSIGFWHPAKNDGPGPGYYPYIAFNTTKQSRVGCKGWAVRPGEVAMEASIPGQYSLVRFVAPVAGTYKVSAQFEGIHYGLSTTDVHVLHNAASLFDADIDGYGGDPAFHKVEGANPAASYSGQVRLKAGDTVTFAVGYGKDKTNSSDTTGLFARVVLLAGAKNGRRIRTGTETGATPADGPGVPLPCRRELFESRGYIPFESRHLLLRFDGGRADGRVAVARRVADHFPCRLEIPAHARIIGHQIQYCELHRFRQGRTLHAVAKIAIAQPHLLTP